MNLLWNTYEYRETYTSEVDRPEELELEDEWILSRMNSMVREVKKNSSEPNFTAFRAVRAIEEFAANDLSRGYIQMIRDRLRPGYDGEDRQSAEWTLRKVTDELLKVLAPFTPYFADYNWSGEDSIHLEDYPEVQEEFVDEELERSMDLFQDIEEAVARLRQQKGIKLRHPVKKVTVSGNEEVEKAVENLRELLREELNSREVEFEQVELDYVVKLDYSKAGPELGGDVGEVESALQERDYSSVADQIDQEETVEVAGHELEPEMFDVRTYVPDGMDGEEFSSGTVYIDDERTEELLDDALVAEAVRAIQQKRKEAGLEVDQAVELRFWGDDDALRNHRDEVVDRVNVSSVEFGEDEMEYTGDVEFENRKVKFGFSNPVK